ncbi:hypothetical protein ABG768_018821 [Culter alburnus]|uniref:Uncharacterized protein n=1 Tax=Culter alburnus TaxID=194366 RepID=A0AAW2ATB6_CULAL
MAQKDPDLLTEKLVSYVDYVSKAVSSKKILEKDIIAMDETAVWFDMVSPSTVDTRGAKSGHDTKKAILPLSSLTKPTAPN